MTALCIALGAVMGLIGAALVRRLLAPQVTGQALIHNDGTTG